MSRHPSGNVPGRRSSEPMGSLPLDSRDTEREGNRNPFHDGPSSLQAMSMSGFTRESR